MILLMKKIKVTYIVVLALVVFVVLMIVTLNDMGVHSLKELDKMATQTPML